MAVGLSILLGIALVLPAVAYLGARRLPPPRHRAVRPDLEYDWVRRHRLGTSDHVRIKEAVEAGRRVEPERLVPAARELAELLLGRRPAGAGLREQRPWLWGLVVAGYVGVLAVVIWKYPSALGGFLGSAGVFLVTRRQRWKLEQALVANAPVGATTKAPEYDTNGGG
jgi:hypothetical protein